ncbi:hypothetical protein CSUI_006950 [Cystoisospora suis]|uniref:Uncharacterized protein n=1 Tax=Cystoisospora suis TaxID=483139 RepID=A0A2C6KRQ3_9APIC|nr:hypothetical protein CSUI_006950 [Cystoisospora suis]
MCLKRKKIEQERKRGDETKDSIVYVRCGHLSQETFR